MIGSGARRATVGVSVSGALMLCAIASCHGELSAGYNLPKGSDAGNGGSDGGLCVPESTTECYTGPAGTNGVGLCRPGTAICNADGMAYGSCEGAVLPRAEDCATPTDEDCDGLAPACKCNLLWAKRFGNDSIQESYRIAVDGAGDILITGRSVGAVDFGGGPLVSAGFADLIIAKLNAAGEHLWSKRFDDAAEQPDICIIGSCADIFVAVDSADNVLIAGALFGTMDFGGGPLTGEGNADLFVAKLDASGTYLWARRFGDGSFQVANGIALDDTGNVYIAGSFLSTVDFGGGVLASAGDSDAFIVKLNAGGAYVWAKRFGDTSAQRGGEVAVDDEGNLLMTGRFSGLVDFGGGPLTSTGENIYVAKLDTDGSHIWSKRFGEASTSQARVNVTIDDTGQAVLSGHFDGAIDFGDGTLTSAGGTDLFITKLDALGDPTFSMRSGDANDQTSYSVAVDGAGNALVAGYLKGILDLGGGPIASAGGKDTLLAKLDTTGSHLCSKRFGDADSQVGTSVAVDKAGNAVLAGTFFGSIDFGDGPLVSAGAQDIFIARFSP